MTLEEIAAIEIPAADNAVLFLWAVNSLLMEAGDIIKAWGFTCKTNLAWIKPSIGPGGLTRNRHELLLWATRGTYPAPDGPNRPDSIIQAPRRAHSQKPDQAYAIIETAYPRASKIELFARNTRPGWHQWGNQAPPNTNPHDDNPGEEPTA